VPELPSIERADDSLDTSIFCLFSYVEIVSEVTLRRIGCEFGKFRECVR
jgi:hypothetical protein